MSNQSKEVELAGAGNSTVKISNDVIAIIVGLSLNDEPDIDKALKKGRGKGLSIQFEGEELTLNLDLNVAYGVKIPELSRRVQEKVKAAVENMTGFQVKAVNINITGVNIEKSDKSAKE